MVSGAIKEHLIFEICNEKIGWGEFSKWENQKYLRIQMYDDQGYKSKLHLSYFDIPHINDSSKQSNDFF